MNDDPEPYWAEFLHAAESAALGNVDAARALVQKHPIVREELRAFVKAIKEGRIVKTDGAWRSVKTRGRVRAPVASPRGYGLDAGVPVSSYEEVAVRLRVPGAEGGD
jgi:hypothetical protein